MLSTAKEPTKYNGFYIDIGLSEYTHLLENVYGWHGICIDANHQVVTECRNNRSNALCIQGLVWLCNTYLDFDIQNNTIVNIPYNTTNYQIESKELTEAKTLHQLLVDNSIEIPSVIDYISLNTSNSEIYILDYLLKQNIINITNISIKYSSNFYLQKLLELILQYNKLYLQNIDNQYIFITKNKASNNSVWISEKGFFSKNHDASWCALIDKEHINQLKLTDKNEHCLTLTNNHYTYKICHNELYQILNNNAHKITDGHWISC